MSKNFVIYNKITGDIITTGFCPEEDFNKQVVGPDEAILEPTMLVDPDTDVVDIATQKIIKNRKTKPKIPQPQPEVLSTYAGIRKQMYPSVHDQLDMLWHAMDTGQVPKAEPFYSALQSVKQAVPKDSDFKFKVGNI